MQKVAAENNKISNVFNEHLLTELSTHGLGANTRNVYHVSHYEFYSIWFSQRERRDTAHFRVHEFLSQTMLFFEPLTAIHLRSPK